MEKHFNLIFLFSLFLISLPHLYFKHFHQLEIFSKAEPYFALKELWTETEIANLRQLVKNQKVFHTAAQDSTCVNEDLEIKVPKIEDGSCPHAYLTPEDHGPNCVLPGRIDIFKHYALTGGKYGAKESMKQLVSNVQSFQKYLFGQDLELPELQSLFNSEKYQKVTQGICGTDHTYSKRVQVNLIIMVPGQDLPMHLDLPWFRSGANRFNLPQWLLLAMAGSGIWRDEQFPQVQGVAYIHETPDISGGNFFLYPSGPGGPEISLKSQVNTGTVLDGIKVIHGVQRYNPDKSAPKIGKGEHFLTYYPEQDKWWISDTSGTKIKSLLTEDLRVSLVWRSVCFQTQQEMENWDPKKSKVNSTEILQKLKLDLRSKGKTIPENDVDFALLLIDEYVKYPIDNWENAWIPLNYCTFPELVRNQPTLYRFLINIFSFFC